MNESVDGKVVKVEFNSLAEFYSYLCETPLNDAFRWSEKASDDRDNQAKVWTKTESFEEASELFKHGWSEMSDKLVQKLKAEESKMEPVMVSKNSVGVQGYQPIVPLYLMGIPTNMACRKMTPVKQKVITLNKCVNYPGFTSSDKIVDESIKALLLIKKLEAQNYRCNLNLVLGTYTYDRSFVVKIRIKSANEKLNVSKLSFPLVHPSMLRRLLFRFIEVHPLATKAFVGGYGKPIEDHIMRAASPGEYHLPAFIRKDVKSVHTLDDLEKIV